MASATSAARSLARRAPHLLHSLAPLPTARVIERPTIGGAFRIDLILDSAPRDNALLPLLRYRVLKLLDTRQVLHFQLVEHIDWLTVVVVVGLLHLLVFTGRL